MSEDLDDVLVANRLKQRVEEALVHVRECIDRWLLQLQRRVLLRVLDVAHLSQATRRRGALNKLSKTIEDIPPVLAC